MEYTVLKVHIVSINKNILSSLEYTVLKTHGKHIYKSIKNWGVFTNTVYIIILLSNKHSYMFVTRKKK